MLLFFKFVKASVYSISKINKTKATDLINSMSTMDEESTIRESNQSEVTCPSCGGNLLFMPGTSVLRCEHCGTDKAIEESTSTVDELDFEEYVSSLSESIEKHTINTTRCESCGASVSFDPNVVSERCPFCSSILVINNSETQTQIKPGSLLPFGITKNKAYDNFRTWIKKLWFAPNSLKQHITEQEALKGLYIPYWTYDADTTTQYSGLRGDHYTEQETYTVMENGSPVTRTRTVTKTRWTNVSGTVSSFFDDILILASKSLPKNKANKLEPWDLSNLKPFDELYLSGFRTETYQVDLKSGYAEAKQIMENEIYNLIKMDIGGDVQQIVSKSTVIKDVKFKHILLPIYISAYKFRKKIYRFLVNARTGEVQGERPYSAWKIIMFILLLISIFVGIWYLVGN